VQEGQWLLTAEDKFYSPFFGRTNGKPFKENNNEVADNVPQIGSREILPNKLIRIFKVVASKIAVRNKEAENLPKKV
jgi:hypothetical protein